MTIEFLEVEGYPIYCPLCMAGLDVSRRWTQYRRGFWIVVVVGGVCLGMINFGM